MIKKIGVKEVKEEIKTPLIERGVYINNNQEYYVNGIGNSWLNRDKQIVIFTDIKNNEVLLLGIEKFLEEFKRK